MEKSADKSPVAVIFGEILRQHRRRAGLSQMALAEQSDLDRTYISFLERGVRQPSLKVLLQLGRALGVSTSDLVSEVERTLGEGEV